MKQRISVPASIIENIKATSRHRNELADMLAYLLQGYSCYVPKEQLLDISENYDFITERFTFTGKYIPPRQE